MIFNVKDFGAIGNSINDDTKSIQKCFRVVETYIGPVTILFPEGIYNISEPLQLFLFSPNVQLIGNNATIFRIDKSLNKDFTPMISVKTNVITTLIVNGLIFNGNASNNPLPINSEPTIFEHSACLSINGQNFKSISISNCIFNDCTGDGVLVGGDKKVVSGRISMCNIQELIRNRTRSGITITCDYEDLIISNSNVEKMEVETNGISQSNRGNVIVSNCIIKKGFDFNYKNNSNSTNPILLLNNSIITGRMNICGFHSNINNCEFNLTETNRINSGNSGNRCDVNYSNCTFKNEDNFKDQYLISVMNPDTSPRIIKFINCNFDVKNIKYIFWDNNSVYDDRISIFEHNIFNGQCENVFYFRSGKWFINNNIFVISSNLLINQTSVTLNIKNYTEVCNNRIFSIIDNLFKKPNNKNIEFKIESNSYIKK